MSNYLVTGTNPDDDNLDYEMEEDDEEDGDFSDAPDPLEDYDDDTEVGDDDWDDDDYEEF